MLTVAAIGSEIGSIIKHNGRIGLKANLVIDEETFLTTNGASRLSIGESALHKNKGKNSDKIWKKIVDRQAAKDKMLIEKREQLRIEYQSLCDQGVIRSPSRIERLIETAQGHDDNEAVQAARRLLTKQNISWKN